MTTDKRPACMTCGKAILGAPPVCKCLSGFVSGFRPDPGGTGWLHVTVGEWNAKHVVPKCNDDDGCAD